MRGMKAEWGKNKMPLTQSIFDTKEALNHSFAEQITQLLKNGILENGRASLVVSGGRTPMGLFAALSNVDLGWENVDVTLADERWVDESDDASNAKLVRENLLVNFASKANFVSLKTQHSDASEAVAACTSQLQQMQTPFDVLILGMGEDGHTASLFPCSDQVLQGLDMDSGNSFIAVQPTTAPNQRMSLTLPALLNSRKIFLHLTGEAKKEVLQNAIDGQNESEMPIRAVLNRADVELVWAP